MTKQQQLQEQDYSNLQLFTDSPIHDLNNHSVYTPLSSIVYVSQTVIESLQRFQEELDEIRQNLFVPKKQNPKKNFKKLRVISCKTNTKHCSICQQRIIRRSRIIKLQCKHYHHKGCLEKWLHKNQSCPLCRIQVK